MSTELLQLSLGAAILAWVFVYKLNGEGEPLYFWRYFLERVLRIRSRWLLNPLLDCEYCVAGQLAFWYYLAAYFCEYNFIEHILFTGVTIFFVELIYQLRWKD